jgi:hypothetical protein
MLRTFCPKTTPRVPYARSQQVEGRHHSTVCPAAGWTVTTTTTPDGTTTTTRTVGEATSNGGEPKSTGGAIINPELRPISNGSVKAAPVADSASAAPVPRVETVLLKELRDIYKVSKFAPAKEDKASMELLNGTSELKHREMIMTLQELMTDAGVGPTCTADQVFYKYPSLLKQDREDLENKWKALMSACKDNAGWKVSLRVTNPWTIFTVLSKSAKTVKKVLSASVHICRENGSVVSKSVKKTKSHFSMLLMASDLE